MHGWRHGKLSLFALVLATTAATLGAPDRAVAQPQPTLEPRQLPELAESGQFQELLGQLKSDYVGRDAASVESLIADLERYREHRAEDARLQREAYGQALDDARQAMTNQRLEHALAAAIDAHRLAEDPEAMLGNDLVQELVRHAEEAAAEAKVENHWVDALSLYRLLDLLYEENGTYQSEVKEAQRHVRVLQIYAPKQLRELYEARRAAMQQRAEEADEQEAGVADDTIDPPTVDAEPWQERLRDVELPMLRQALSQAARQHVSGDGYESLMAGAVDALLVFLRTDAVAETFPTLRNQAPLQRFERYLASLDKRLQDPDTKIEFWDAVRMVEHIMRTNNQTVKLPERVLVYEMGEGATSALDDFTGMIWPRQREQFARSTQGKFFGVGIQISRRNGQLLVVSPLPETPAQQAGIKAGDVIAEVDGQDTSTWGLDKAVREITGPEGTVVTLGISRSGEPEIIEYDIQRAEIEIESIRGWQWKDARKDEWDYFIDPDSRIGYVRISQFISTPDQRKSTAKDLDRAIEQMQADGSINGLILDLRFNPGGLLQQAVEVAGRFVNEGPLVFTVTPDGERKLDPAHRGEKYSTYSPFPIAVLINEGSASASEIVSGALQDYGRAVVVGERSFGKGSVQDVLPLDRRHRAYLKLTTQHYMLPLGRIIHRQPHDKAWGVEPDLHVTMTNQQAERAVEFRQEADVLRDDEGEAINAEDRNPQRLLTDGLDPQLEAALLVLKTRLAASQIAMAQLPDRQTASQ